MSISDVLALLTLPLLLLWQWEVGRRQAAEKRLETLKRAILLSNALSAEQLNALLG